MTTWKSILIGQRVASSARTALFWASSSNVPDDPIMSCFLLARLLMNHQGKHFQAWRMQKSGSCTARRFPLEDSFWTVTAGRRNASTAFACHHQQGFTGAQSALQLKIEPISFSSAESAQDSTAATYVNAFKPIYSELHIHTCSSRTPVILPLCTPRVIILVAHFSKRQEQKIRIHPKMICKPQAALLFPLPEKDRASYQIGSCQHLKGKHCDYPAWWALSCCITPLIEPCTG